MPTAEQRRTVVHLAGVGTRQEDIAALFDINPLTLVKHFARELATGATRLKRKAVNVVVRNMESSNEFASQKSAEFLLARRFGWSERHDNVNLNAEIGMSPEERVSLREQILQWDFHREPVRQLPAPSGTCSKQNKPPERVIDSTAEKVPDEPAAPPPASDPNAPPAQFRELTDQERRERVVVPMMPPRARGPGGRFQGDL